MITEKAIADELKLASKRLRCDHHYPWHPPRGTLLEPGDCLHCGKPFPSDAVIAPRPLREPLADLFDAAARVVRDHPQDPDYAGLPDTKYCTECNDEETACVAFVDGALAVARALASTRTEGSP